MKAFWLGIYLLVIPFRTALAFLPTSPSMRRLRHRWVFYAADSASAQEEDARLSLEKTILTRYACKQFKRFTAPDDETVVSASDPDPTVVQKALHCLDLARMAPSSFNSQPYKLILVHSAAQKLALSRYCLGANAARVRDSDCTALFLADRQVVRTLPRLARWMQGKREERNAQLGVVEDEAAIRQSKSFIRTMFLYLTIFSSGFPLPRVLAAPIAFLFRVAMGIMAWFSRSFYQLPSLASAETWSSKQALMVAMVYMLGCSSHGLATIPMEGIDAPGIRKVLKIPSRYAVPLIVATGVAAKTPSNYFLERGLDRRFPRNDVIYDDIFGSDQHFRAFEA